MDKPFMISLNDKDLKEINTALRIMHARRDNQYKYLKNKNQNKNPDKIPNRKPNKYLTLNIDDGKLEYIVSNFIPTRKCKTNEIKHNNSSDEDKENINPIINDKTPNEL